VNATPVYADARALASGICTHSKALMDSTCRPAPKPRVKHRLTTICGKCEREWPTDSGRTICPKCGNDGESDNVGAHVIRDEADFPEPIADPLAEYRKLETRVRASMAEYPTGERALAAKTLAEVWRRELPIQDAKRALDLRIIREAQRSCLAIVQRWAPNQSESFYLGLIQGIVADDRPDRTTVEREVITHYRATKARARQAE
jgi:hypothetical protein